MNPIPLTTKALKWLAIMLERHINEITLLLSGVALGASLWIMIAIIIEYYLA